MLSSMLAGALPKRCWPVFRRGSAALAGGGTSPPSTRTRPPLLMLPREITQGRLTPKPLPKSAALRRTPCPTRRRRPAPVLRHEEVQELVRHAVFLQRVAHPQIAFEVTTPSESVVFECDGRLVSQALTNVLKNAVEAIAVRMASGDMVPGRIAIDVA